MDPIATISATFQVGSPSFMSHFFSQLTYGCVQLSSYLLLYVKQDMLFRNGLGDLMTRRRKLQRKLVLVLYVVAFVMYWFFGLLALNEGVRLRTVYEDETTQYIRVM
jgi:hypothetical protein